MPRSTLGRGRATSRTRSTDRAEDGGSPEEVQARAWLKAHRNDPTIAGAALPSDVRRDPETGESLVRESAFDQSEDHRALVSYSKWDTVQDWEERRLQQGPYDPLVGRSGLTPEQLDKRIRMERAFRGLSDRDQEALRLHYFEQLSVAECGAEWRVSKSTAQGRIERAVQNLYRAIGATWGQDYDLMKEVFG